MGFFFYWTLNMSVCASIVLCVILLLRRIKKIPRRIIRLLYIPVLFRLLCPLSFGSRFSLMALFDRFCAKTISVRVYSALLYSVNFTQAAETYSPLTYKTDFIKSIFEAGGVVWIFTASFLLCVLLAAYIRTALQTRNTVKIEKTCICAIR